MPKIFFGDKIKEVNRFHKTMEISWS